MTLALPWLAGLFIPPGTSEAPPITGSSIPTEPSKSLLLSCSGRTKPGHVTPLLGILQCFPFSPAEATSITVGHKALPLMAFPTSPTPLLQPLWPRCCSSNVLSMLLPQGLCTGCSCSNVCMICFLTSLRSLLKCRLL